MTPRTAVYAGTRNIYHDMVVSAKSLLYNNGADRVVFLIEDDTFPEDLPSCITTMNVSGQTFFPSTGPNFKSKWTYMVMMRTALTKLFPGLDRILSLDHDTIVRKPIDFLWDIDISNHYFAAVEENQIGIRQHPYFNFGVVMHNLAALRDGMDDTIISTVNSVYFDFCEQDAVNSLCRNNILQIPPAYNAMLFNRPLVPEEDVIIRHYAAFNWNLRSCPDYLHYSNIHWKTIFPDYKGDDIHMSVPLKRYDIINQLIRSRHFRAFLEIGTDKGETFRSVAIPHKTSVDPDLSTQATHHMTSDDFFATCTDKFDIIFIDGLHEHNQAYRDICNALDHINPNGVIVIHDCLPTSEPMQRYSDHYPGGLWTGDVWKAFVKARAEFHCLMYTIDTDFGCGIIDTSVPAEPDKTLSTDMETMTYEQFVQNRNEWMNVKGEIQDAEEK